MKKITLLVIALAACAVGFAAGKAPAMPFGGKAAHGPAVPGKAKAKGKAKPKAPKTRAPKKTAATTPSSAYDAPAKP